MAPPLSSTLGNMNRLKVYYCYKEILPMLFGGWLIATIAELLHRGQHFIARGLSDPILWFIMSIGFGTLYLLLRLVPVATFSEEAVKCRSYPRTVRWSEFKKCNTFSFVGLSWLRIYGQRSRFAVWIPLQQTALQQIQEFVEKNSSPSILLSCSND